MGPLSGIKVLDLTRILAGPWATQVLADFGAEVWKIEQPEMGDDTRRWGPPFLADADGQPTQESAYYLSANRGKHSLTIDIAKPEGQKLLHDLMMKADIVVENFKVGGLKKYQLDYEFAKTLNPKIIYCSITGFGQTGPAAQHAGYDAMIQGMGGLMSITGVEPESPGAGPQKVGVAVADLMTGMYAVTAILAALHHRNSTGQGQYIDLALLDTQVSWLANQGMNYLVGGQVPKQNGTAHPNIVPYQAFKTADGHIMLAVGNDAQFTRCCTVLGLTDIPTDPRFSTNSARVAHRAILVPLLTEAIGSHTLDFLKSAFNASGVPCGPINTIDRVFNEPQIKHREMEITLEHPLAGSVAQIANPVKFTETPIDYKKAPPLLGEDTDLKLTELLGLSAAEMTELRASGVI